jgi:hypothetical protein
VALTIDGSDPSGDLGDLLASKLAYPSGGSDGDLLAKDGTAAEWIAVPEAGLTLITSESFSAVSSVSINNCFTSTYDNYKIVISGVHSAASGAIKFRYRSSGSDDAGNNYFWQLVGGNNTTAVAARQSSVSSGEIGYLAQRDIIEVILTSPSAVQLKIMVSQTSLNETLGLQILHYANAYSQTTSRDGFSIFPNTGTITGNVRVYGFRN